MMGRQTGDQSQLFYLFNLERRIPASHLLRRINPIVTRILVELREKLTPFYSDIGRPSIDPELMIRMLIVGYCYGIRFERRLCEEVELHMAYRWFCRLDLDDKVPDHSTFSVNRHGRFRDSDLLRQVFEAVVRACMDAGLIKGEGFAIDASVMEADASRYYGKAPGEIDWSLPERQTRAAAEFLGGLEDEDPDANRKLPKAISPTDPCSAWTAKANKRVQFGYGLNYMIDVENAVIVNVEATPARTYDEVAATRTMIDRTETTFGLKPGRLAADTAYGTGKLLAWLLDKDITPHIPVKEGYERTDVAHVVELKAAALIIGPFTFFVGRGEQLATLAIRYKVPTIYQYRPFAVAGGLMSYGSDETEYYHLVGVFTGRILKGENPAQLPVEQSTKVELIINLKTAKALGIDVPLSLLGRADEVIE